MVAMRNRSARKASGWRRTGPVKKRASRGTVEHILRAARGVLIEHGHAEFTTRRVAEAAAISPGNLSYHFPTKRALLQALIAQLVAEYAAQFESFLSNADIPAGQELQHLVPWLLTDAVTEEAVHTFRELWALSLHDAVIRQATDNLYDRLMELVAALLQRAHPDSDANAIREVVQFLAMMAEGSAVLYGTRRKRAVGFDRMVELTLLLTRRVAPELHRRSARK